MRRVKVEKIILRKSEKIFWESWRSNFSEVEKSGGYHVEVIGDVI